MFLLLFSFAATTLFGGLAIFFSIRDERIKQKILDQNALEKKRLFEISILKTIQDKIGYSLDIEQVVDTLTGSLKRVFSYATVSSLRISGSRLLFKVFIEEPVNAAFIEHVKKSMVTSFQALVTTPLPPQIEQLHFGMNTDESMTKGVSSFFYIPLLINGKTRALINVASTKPNLYKDEEITMFYEIAQQASTTLSKLEQVLETEEGKLLALIASLTEGILMIDANSTVSTMNENAKKLLRLPTDTPTLVDLHNAFPSQFDFANKIRAVMKEQKPIEEKEVSFGNTILHIIMMPVLSTNYELQKKHSLIGVSVVLHDITLEKQMAKLKEDFTSEVVHELRSPLTAIQSGSALMIDQKEHLDQLQREKLLEIINTQSKRMLGDINSLLDAAKLESGHFAINQKSEDIERLLQDAEALFDSEAKKKQISLSVEIQQNLPKGLFDQIRINQVLNNLLSNSLKYTPDGGKIVIKAVSYFNQQLPQTQTNPGICISISDNGIGIPKDKQPGLFSKFARLENVGYVHSKEGTGLGLYITKGIIEAHGGSIFLESQPGKGTTVSFTLPLAGPLSST